MVHASRAERPPCVGSCPQVGWPRSCNCQPLADRTARTAATAEPWVPESPAPVSAHFCFSHIASSKAAGEPPISNPASLLRANLPTLVLGSHNANAAESSQQRRPVMALPIVAANGNARRMESATGRALLCTSVKNTVGPRSFLPFQVMPAKARSAVCATTGLSTDGLRKTDNPDGSCTNSMRPRCQTSPLATSDRLCHHARTTSAEWSSTLPNRHASTVRSPFGRARRPQSCWTSDRCATWRGSGCSGVPSVAGPSGFITALPVTTNGPSSPNSTELTKSKLLRRSATQPAVCVWRLCCPAADSLR
mmetsp:Transcript_39055/g.85201  ORF Transcript_39055/g.85201 Transcript_39055/m.85201 type:complete len:307 (-) Transcript_39055:868-1788(-)